MNEDGRLSPDDHERVFRERIIPEVLSNAVPQETPAAIMLGGQPGIGKSSSKRALRENLAGGVVDFSADLMRPYHRRFTELLQGDERLLSDLDAAIDQDARLWVDKALAYAISERFNVIFDSNLANPARAGIVAEKFASAGYSTEVVFVAGAGALSRLGVLDRYQRQVEEQGMGAYCPPEIHDRNYRGVLETANLIDSGEIRVDGVTVYRRGGGDPLYENHRGESGEWSHPPAARQSIVSERERLWTVPESNWFIKSAASLAERIAEPYFPDLREAVRRADVLLQPEDREMARALTLDSARSFAPSQATEAEIEKSGQRLSEIRDRLNASAPTEGMPLDVHFDGNRHEHPEQVSEIVPEIGPGPA